MNASEYKEMVGCLSDFIGGIGTIQPNPGTDSRNLGVSDRSKSADALRCTFRGAVFIKRAVGSSPCSESHAALFPINCEVEVEKERDGVERRERGIYM